MSSTRHAAPACALVLLAAGLASAAPVPSEDGILRYKFKEGDRMAYTLEEKSTIDLDPGTGPMNIVAATTFDVTWQVTKVGKDGKATITQTFERVRLNAETPQGKTEYDSKTPGAPADEIGKVVAQALGALVGGETILTFDPRAGLETLKFSERLSGGLAKLPAGAGVIGTSLTEDTVRRMIAQCVPALPKEAPVRDRPWESKLDAAFQEGAKLRLQNQHKHAGTTTLNGKTLDKITTKSTLEIDSTGPAMLKVEDQDVGSTAHFDRARGRLVESVYTQKLTLVVTVAETMLKMKATTTTTLKLAQKEK